ncbi:MAG TPA: hypothetical protein VGD64_07790 [Acidisarcina sp.]
MYTRLDRAHRALPVILGVITLSCAAMLLAWDGHPTLFSVKLHLILEASSLASIALAYLIYQTAHRPAPREWVKAILLATAFLFWAANQIWPNQRQATAFNDVAIALFVLDVFLVMIGWPATSPDESFAERYKRPGAQNCERKG